MSTRQESHDSVASLDTLRAQVHDLSERLTSQDVALRLARLIASVAGPEVSPAAVTWLSDADGETPTVHTVRLPAHDADPVIDEPLALAAFPWRSLLDTLQPGAALHVDDVTSSPLVDEAGRTFCAEHAIRQLTVVPLHSGAHLSGLIWLGGPPLDPLVEAGLNALAAQMAQLQANQGLMGQTVDALDELRHLHRMGRAIAQAEDGPVRLLQAAHAHFATPPDYLAIEAVQVDDHGQPALLVPQATITQGEAGANGAPVDVDDQDLMPYLEALMGGAPLLVNNVKTDPSLPPHTRAYFEAHALGAAGVFPIMAGGRVTHLLTAGFREPHLFSASEIRLLHRLGEQLGMVLRAGQAGKGAGLRETRLLTALSDVARQMGGSLVSGDALRLICQSLSTVLELSYVMVARFDQVPSSGNIVAEYPDRLGAGTLLALEGFAAYKHIQSYRTPLTIEKWDEASEQLGPNTERFEALDTRALLFAPLVVQDELMGLLALGTDRPHAFSREEIHASQALATQIAISLRNAELFAEIQQRATQLERIAAFGRLVTSTFDRAEILRRVMDVIPNLLPATHVHLALYALGQDQMRVITLANNAEPVETSEAAAGTSVEEMVQTQIPMLIPDLASSNYADHQRMAGRGLAAVLSAPLVIGGRTLGTVSIGHQRPRIYTVTDLTLLQQVGNQIAIALENARLFQMARQRASYEESLSEITSRLQQPSDLRDLLQQTMQDLGQVLGARRARVRLQVQPGSNGRNGSKVAKPEK